MTILDEPIQPKRPNLFIARISGPLEFFSIGLFLVGALFKLQSWPFASEMLLTGGLGLCAAYLILFPIRLFGLKSILPRTDFNYALAAGISIGLLIAVPVLTLITKVYLWTPALGYVLQALQILALIGVVSAFVYDFIRTQPAPNTAEYAIAFWLRKRLNILMVLVAFRLLFRFLL